MIPNRNQCLLLYDKYKMPSEKRIHLEEVTRLALYFADKLEKKGIAINKPLVEAAGLLHDIDKNVKKLPGEKHPDAAVRILKELGFGEVGEITRKHSLHSILDSELAPTTWEEKIVYLADKMTKYEIIGVDHRFKLWERENLPQDAQNILKQSYPKVKQLEAEVYQAANIDFSQIQKDFDLK